MSTQRHADGSGGPAAPRQRGPALGIAITVLLFLAAVAIVSWLMYRSGLENHNYYDKIMTPGS
jgi:hypothetical protein